MHAVFAGSAAGAGWVAVSFFTENIWPLGDWRWGVCAAVIFVVAGLVHWHGLRRNSRRKQPVVGPVGPPAIQPADTITPHGVLTMGPTGYPERLTTWDALREGALAPSPGEGPASPPIGPAGVSSASSLDRLSELWLASPGAGRLTAELICKVSNLEAAREIWAAFYAAPRRTETRYAYFAFASRLNEAGEDWEFGLLAERLMNDGEEIDLTRS